MVAQGTSLEIGLPTTSADSAGDPPRDAESARTSDSRPSSAQTASVESSSPLEAALVCLESLVTAAPLWPAAVNAWQRFRASQARQPAPASEAVETEAGGISGIDQTAERSALHQPGDKGVRGGDASQHVCDVDLTRLKFRFSVVRDGRHPFGSVDASPRLGAAVSSVHRGWTVDLKV